MNDLYQEYKNLYHLAQQEHDLEIARWSLTAIENKVKENHPNPIKWESKLPEAITPYKWPNNVDYTVLDREMLVAAEQIGLHRFNPAGPDSEILANLEKHGHFYPTPLDARFPHPNVLFNQEGHLFNDETDLDGYTNDMRDYIMSSQNDLKSLGITEAAILKVSSPWLIGDSRQISQNGNERELNMQTSSLKKQRDEIIENGALEVGYSNNVKAEMLDLDPDLLAKTFADEGVVSILTAEAQKGAQNHQNEFDNVLVTEMVRNMELEDFESVSDFFFNNQKEYTENGYKSLNPSPVDLSQSTYKQLKKEIVDNNALNVGYLQEVKSDMLYLDPNILEKVLSNKDTVQALSSEANKANQGLTNQFDNILVTEMTRELNYQDFKLVAPKFMNFAKAEQSQQEDLDFVASQLENNINL
ncbi:hypothetical protein [Fructobacillus tropaeoli]|uniref:hypothetical protein n=1 Tax=Fructobacillus tropaeoli TaxID=709323 RepID=UPI0019430E05|nr:hypothetical protein [Fructobacillus tropaeoli]GIC69392.1 hypothetical protein FT12353_00280 [Fructobacillus tropaeoli]